MRSFIIEEDAHPSIPKLMLATLDALRHIGGSGSIQEIDETVIEREGVTEAEQAIMLRNDHRPKLNYYLAWARTYLRRGGALDNSARGIWALTESGEKIVDETVTQAIYDQVQQEERERIRTRKKAPARAGGEVPEQESEETEPSVNGPQSWKDELLDTLKSMDPSAFERLSQRVLREAGFVKVEVRGQTGDGGIDGIGVLRVNLVSFQVYFQCKRWKGSVGSKEIRDFRGALQGRADKGLFITTGTFTSQASDEATRDGAIAIDLIDGERLCDLLKQFELGIQTEMIERVRVNSSWFESL